MKDKILAALKKGIVDPKTGKTSISDKTLNTYVELIAPNVTEESQIEPAVATYIPILKEVQANINSVAAEAVRNIKPAEPKPAEIEPAAPKEEGEVLPKWVQGIMNDLKELKGEKLNDGFLKSAKDVFTEKQIPEEYYGPAISGRRFEKQEDVDSFVATVTGSYEKFQQKGADDSKGVPPEGGTRGAGGNEDAKGISALINSGTKEITESSKK